MMESELDRALHGTLAVLTKVQPRDLDAPTPCASWDVRGLVNHFVGTTRWWAANIAGESDGDGDAPEVDHAAGDFVAAFEDSIGIAAAAFGANGAMERTVLLPFGEFPGAVVYDMAATELFTHGWDLARAIGQPTNLDPELAMVLLGKAKLAVTDAFRGPDGQAPFGPAREAPPGAGPADQLAAFLGRAV